MAVVLEDKDKLMLGGLGLALVGLVAFIITDPPDPPEPEKDELIREEEFEKIIQECKSKYNLVEAEYGGITTEKETHLEKVVFGGVSPISWMYYTVKFSLIPGMPPHAFLWIISRKEGNYAGLAFREPLATLPKDVELGFVEDLRYKVLGVGYGGLRVSRYTSEERVYVRFSKLLTKEQVRKLIDVFCDYCSYISK